MGNACGALLDQPRPNPKDSSVNLCSIDTVSYEEASSGEDIPVGGLVEAGNYCNLRGSDPKLRYGFSKFDNLAQTDPDKYGKILFEALNSKLYGGDSAIGDPNSIFSSGDVNLTAEELKSLFTGDGKVAKNILKNLSIRAIGDLAEAFELFPGVGSILAGGILLGQLLAGGISSAITNSNSEREKDYCNKIGDTFEGDTLLDTEWAVYDNGSGHCYYNDGDRGYATEKNKCCNGNCSIVGARLRCVRQNFRADPFVCCFNDFNCNSTSGDSCFQTPARQRTCHPNYRDLSSETCRNIIYDYCVGNKLLPTQNDWLEMWLEDSYVELNSRMITEKNQFTATGHFNPTPDDIHQRGRLYPNKQKQPCLRAIARAVSNSKICTFEDLQDIDVVETIINSEGFRWSKGVVEAIFKKYNDEGGSFLGGINTDGLNRDAGFQNTFWKICNKIPGICTDILTETCSSYTTDDIVSNPNLSQWCSCYMKDSEYERYEKFDIQRECTPICNRDGVIPLITNEGQTKYCLSTVCMIDEITVKLVETENTGSINFNQICGSCGKSNVKSRYLEKSDSTPGNNSQNFPLYGVIPPEVDRHGNYESVYGSGYDNYTSSATNGVPPCYIVPESIYKSNVNSLSNFTNIDDYPQCNFYIAKSANGNYGIYSISTIVPSGTTQLKSNEKVVLNLYKDSKGHIKKFVDDNNAATLNILKSTSNIVEQKSSSKATNRYAGSDYNVTENSCVCITKGDNLRTLNEKIRGSVNFNTQCGSTNCFDNDGNPISCSSGSTTIQFLPALNQLEEEAKIFFEKEKFSRIFIILLGLAIILFIMEIVKLILNRF